ncbi:hypothetical protein LTR95_002908 [Oleoguttula sp. CCFEE 5521]
MGGPREMNHEQRQRQHHYKDWPNEAAFNANANFVDVRTPVDISVAGHFPQYVAGALYRTGPGAYKIDSPGSKKGSLAVDHWFDGFTTTHKFDIHPGAKGTCDRICYSSFMQVEKLMATARDTGSLGAGITFGQRDPCDSLYRKAKSVFAPSTTSDPLSSNVGVVLRETLPAEAASIDEKRRVGRRLITITTDTVTAKHVDADTLEPLSITSQAAINPSLIGQMSAAHASHDRMTGEIFNFNLTLGPTPCYKVFRASPDGETEVLAEIKGGDVRGAYLHSLLLTENFVVLCVWPAYFTRMGLGMLWERNVIDALKFEPTSPTHWYVVDRKHGRGVVKEFTSPSFFCFHTVNAWEERGVSNDVVDIVCELVELPDTKILELLRYEYIVSSEAVQSRPLGGTEDKSIPTSHLVRYRLEQIAVREKSTDRPASAKRTMAVISGDLPRINPHYALKPHRYVYTALSRGKSSFLDGIGKTDMQNGTTTIWEEARHTPGEPIFVARPGAVNEDDGVILVVVFDGDASKSYLLCLDAQNLTEVARATVDGPVGLGFHGLHLPATPPKL